MTWNYDSAFSRNRGLIQPHEQQCLRHACVAIAGLGGVGGSHLVTLLRLGIGRFHLADPDQFELPNMNRQYGADMSSLGKSKVEVMAAVARRINPDVELTLFSGGLTAQNCDAFFQGADVAVDGIDFFAVKPRRLFFQQARERGLFALTSAPLGFSATMQIFSPTGMSFDEYLDVRDGMAQEDTLIAFLLGLAPKALHRPYIDLSFVKGSLQNGPCSGLACQLCSGMVTAEIVNLLLKRSPPKAAPWYCQFDAYRRRFVQGRLRLGNRHPLQRLKRWYMKKHWGHVFKDGA